MKKILFFLAIFFLNSEKSISNINKSLDSSLGCNSAITQKYLKNIDKIKIKKIEIDNHNYKKWTVNGIRILINRSRFTPNKYKMRFNATVTVTYDDDSYCIFIARVRHSGDEKDHIAIQGNTIIQSLDVHLNNGNIRGITKFKLLRPDTRGNLEDEIILTELLRNLNYLAPRTVKVNARINEANSLMIFQEKASKELLEFNHRREGPILEGDERFFFKTVENIPDNQLSNSSIGIIPLMNKSAKHMLTKQINSKIILKGEGHQNMSFNASTNLNLIYLYYSNKFQDEKNNFQYFDYDLDNTLLGFFNPKNILNLDVYNLLIIASNGQHGLAPNNRKFYWNSIENYFEPIYYDSNPYINRTYPTTTTAIYRFPISNQFFKAFDVLENKLNEIKLTKIYQNINLSGIKISQEEFNKKIDLLKRNLNSIKNNYLNLSNDELEEHNKFKPINNILGKFNIALNEVDPNVYLVRHKDEGNQLQRCKIFLEFCQDYDFSSEDISKLLEGELILNEKIYQYLGKSLNFENISKHRNYNKFQFNESTIFYNDGIVIENPNKNTLNIIQKTPGSRAYIMGGKINNLKITFNGYKETYGENSQDLKALPNDFPIDINGLTGCLSLINLKVKNISIVANDSSCEDTVNFINVKGKINEINIKNSFSDGLDVDFSNLEINSIRVENSKNDCADFSAGIYKLNLLNLNNCGDKALSVGEKSFIDLNTMNAANSNIGIASKDSSITNANAVSLNNLKTCVAAYNKKQEFIGGFLKIKSMNCKNYYKEAEVDELSKIIEGNRALKN